MSEKELTPEDVDRCLTSALYQSIDAQRCLWTALVNVLLADKKIDHADLAVKISEIAAQSSARGRPIYSAITQSAMKMLVEVEYPDITSAPEEIQKMIRGELVMRRGVHAGAEGVLTVGASGSAEERS